MTEAEGQHEGRRFHLLEVIGAGAFGEVYLAEQDSGAGFRRKVAVKLLHSDVEKIPDAARRMRDEARILGRLSHRHIVTVLDLVRLGERWAVIMDYVPGADLEEVAEALRKAKEPFPLPAALEVGSAVLRALHAAFHADDGHGGQLQVVHRDIKPSNVRITDDGDLKVLDFGVARVQLDSREAQTKATGWMGTERYMAPERILFEGDTAAGDVYAVIATVAELIMGEPLGRTPVLSERHNPFVEERMRNVRAVLSTVDSALVEEVVDALTAGLSPEPTARPTPAALADTLDGLAARCPGEALGPFCRRFVPTIPETLGRRAEPATGVLSEVTSLTSAARSNTTFLPVTPAAPPPKASRMPWLLGLALLMTVGTMGAGVVAVGGLAAAFTWAGIDTVPVPSPAPPVPVPSVEPAPVRPAPAVEPVADAAPTPAPVAEPGSPPVEPAPAPSPAPVAAPSPAPSAEPGATEPVPSADTPRIDRAQVALKDASSVSLTCGDKSSSGTASVRLTDFPAGACSVSAVYLGKTYQTSVTIDRVRGLNCTINGEALSCL